MRIRPLTHMHHRAIALLAQGHSLAQVACLLGVTRSAVWHWSRRPDFAQALAAARQTYESGLLGRLAQMLEVDAESIMRVLLQRARDGDIRALSLAIRLLERLDRLQLPDPSPPAQAPDEEAFAALFRDLDRAGARQLANYLEATCSNPAPPEDDS